jgi:hypothetical protein
LLPQCAADLGSSQIRSLEWSRLSGAPLRKRFVLHRSRQT